MFGKYENQFSGTSEASLCSAVSFYGNKIITTGEGGAFLTCDADVYHYIKQAYSQGMSSVRYVHNVHAYNYRMTNVQAAFLYDQLNDIDNILQTKKRVFERYKRLLQPLIQDGHIALFQEEEDTQSADWIFAVRIIGNKMTIEETTCFFNKNGVDIRPFFYPITSHGHLKDMIVDDEVGSLLNKEVFMVPSSPLITEEEQIKVVEVTKSLINR
jgi:perosamine synthetase